MIGIAGFEDRLLSHEELAKQSKKLELAPETLGRLLYDGRPVVRVNTVNLVATLGALDSPQLAVLVTLLRDDDARVRESVARTLGALRQEPSVSVPRLLDALQAADANAVAPLLEAILAFGDAALDPLLAALDQGTTAVERSVGRVAAARADKLKAPLLHVLADKDRSDRVRENAAELLRALSGDQPDVLAALQAWDQAAALRRQAASRSRVVEPRDLPAPDFATRVLDEKTIAALSDKVDRTLLPILLYDGRVPLRQNALAVAARLGPLSDSDLDIVLTLLRDAVPEVRLDAARTIGALTQAPERSVPRLLAALESADGMFAETLIASVMAFGDKALPQLVRALDAATATVLKTVMHIAERRQDRMREPLLAALADAYAPHRMRENAAELLRLLFKGDRRVGEAIGAWERSLKPEPSARELPPLTIAPSRAAEPRPLPSPDFEARLLDDEALGQYTARLDDEALFAGLCDGRVNVRTNFARAIGLLDRAPGIELRDTLLTLLRDGDAPVRLAAAITIGRQNAHFDPEAAVARLLAARADDEQPSVAAAALEAVLTFGERAHGALVAGLDASTERVRLTVLPVAERDEDQLRELLLHTLDDRKATGRVRENAAELLRTLHGNDKEAMAAVDAWERSLRSLPKASQLPPATQKPSTAREPEPLPCPGFDDKVLDDKALDALAKKADTALVDYLTRALNDGRAPVRINSARLLGRLGERAAPAISTLAVRLLDPDLRVTLSIAQTLGKLALIPEYVMPLLARAAVEGAAAARPAILAATDAFGEAGARILLNEFEKFPQRLQRPLTAVAAYKPDWYVLALGKLLSSKRFPVRERAAHILLELGAAAAPARKDLVKALDQREGGLRVTAVYALAALDEQARKPDKAFIDWLLAHRNDERQALAVACRKALRAFGVDFEKLDEVDDDDDFE